MLGTLVPSILHALALKTEVLLRLMAPLAMSALPPLGTSPLVVYRMIELSSSPDRLTANPFSYQPDGAEKVGGDSMPS